MSENAAKIERGLVNFSCSGLLKPNDEYGNTIGNKYETKTKIYPTPYGVMVFQVW